MKEIVEVVFEKIQIEKAVKFITNLLKTAELKELNIANDGSEINLESKSKLLDSFEKSSDGSSYFNFLNYRIDTISLSEIGLQIYKYNHFYDLSIAIQENELCDYISILDFQKYMESFAKELQATEYYCGYEPAYDLETRFFTVQTLGPRFKWGS